jgi:hypothetical protein
MVSRWLGIASLVGAAALGCTEPQADEDILRADEDSLRASFAERIETSSFVEDFTHDGDELSFSGPDGEGGTAAWVVRIETSLVEPVELDDEMPFQGRILSEWKKDGEVAPFLGNMTAVPKAFQDRGLAQECWAFWIAAERRWDW